MSRVPVQPFLIAKSEDGTFRLTFRKTWMNMYNYPIVTSTVHDEVFPTATAAKAFATTELGALPGQFARA